MARTVEDVPARRLRALILDARASLAGAPRAAELLAAELGFDAAWQHEQVRQFRELARGYLPDGTPARDGTHRGGRAGPSAPRPDPRRPGQPGRRPPRR